jgi:hypothetical protein
MFEKPIDYQVFYPNVVHNQLVNPEYRYKAIKDPETRHKASSFATQSLMYFENDQRAKMLQVGTGLTLPWFDEFGPSSVLPSSVKLLTMLTGITPNNVRDLVNLKTDLEEWEFNPLVMDFLLNSEAPFVGLFFKSIFCLNLYAKNDIVKSGGVELLSSGQVRSTSDLNIRQTYHVRLGIITNLDLLDPEALNRLKKYPEVRDLIIAAIIYALKSCAGDKDIAKNSLSYWDLIRLGVDPDSAYLQAFGKPRPKGPYEKTLDDPVDMDLAQHYLRFMPSLVSTTFIQIKRD